nr:unnamed protein product [Callosobruchus analis]
MYHDDNGDDPPEEFDSRKEWCKCEIIREIRDESKCGSSWSNIRYQKLMFRCAMFHNPTSKKKMVQEG